MLMSHGGDTGQERAVDFLSVWESFKCYVYSSVCFCSASRLIAQSMLRGNNYMVTIN